VIVIFGSTDERESGVERPGLHARDAFAKICNVEARGLRLS
jgi:hypothetical protein